MQKKRLTNFSWEIETRSLDETNRIGQCLARLCVPPIAILLSGTLGSGKTALAQAFLRYKGVTRPIKSPTYDLVHQYRLPDGSTLHHADLYRIRSNDELDFLDLPAPDDPRALLLAEWGDRLQAEYPDHFHVELHIVKDEVRRIIVTAVGDGAIQQLDRRKEGGP